jgi:hypothetical protein
MVPVLMLEPVFASIVLPSMYDCPKPIDRPRPRGIPKVGFA